MPITPPEVDFCRAIGDGMRVVGYRPADPSTGMAATWRTSPKPLELPMATTIWLRKLGLSLHGFNIACNTLYKDSISGRAPSWIAATIDAGKPEHLVRHSRLGHLIDLVPPVIRPDLIATSTGMALTELDAVPGGMGITARLRELYGAHGYVDAGAVALPEAFAAMICHAAPMQNERLIVVVSDESAAYRAEMSWLTQALTKFGIEARMAAPQDLIYTSTSIVVRGPDGDFEARCAYRFFELFDLPNLPGIDGLLKLNAEGHVSVIPPLRYQLEEKAWLAMFHEPSLTDWWREQLGEDATAILVSTIPKGWILDPERPSSVQGTGNDDGLATWNALHGLGRQHRRYVIKPSGFSEFAWGSRGVVVGHDIGTGEWNQAVRDALSKFPSTPHVLQEFHQGVQFESSYLDHFTGEIAPMCARARVSPYYFVNGSTVTMSSVLATLCPLDKKRIHGMPVAIMVSCATLGGAQ